VVRYRFAEFTLSPRRRLLLRHGQEVPLIPRYFDLLLLLVERRHEAVHRRDIFDRVWTDVIVSDSALSQAVRTLRRTLGDDSREPRFIRTVARHGYRFVWAEVIEEDDGPEAPTAFEPLLERVSRPAASAIDDEERREAAELLHALGTSEALRRLGTRPGHASARALLRDARWDTPGAGEVPLLGAPAPLAVARELLRLRLRRAARIAAKRWAGAAAGGGLAGVTAGAAGGLMLAAAPDSAATVAIAPVLAVIGGACGAVGGAGVGAGLAFAEASARSQRALVLIAAAAVGGGVVGAAVQWLARWGLAALVGLQLEVTGALEGIAIGAAAGVGYAIATRNVEGEMAAPRGTKRLRAALIPAVICGLAGLALTFVGRPLVGGTIHMIADAADGSRATLTPLGKLIGEPDFGPFSRGIIAFGEGALFGLGLAYGLMRRPSSPTSHGTVTST
jgi:DNA-binding winged helix-turn-helix (wHTH) protein